MLKIQQIAVGGYDRNFSYFVVENETKEVGIVDPDNVELLIEEIERGGYRPVFILITHSHLDHIRGVDEIAVNYDVPIYIHKNAPEKLVFQREMRRVEDGDLIKLGENEIEVLHTPGHAMDAVCYYIDESFAKDCAPKLITGDTLFVGTVGKASLEGSNVEDFFKSLERIGNLPKDTEIYPGHDYGETPTSTIGFEKSANKYLMCGSVEEFRKLRLG